MAQKISNVLITGANRGIGLGFIKEYLKRGWNVFACSRTISDEMKNLENGHTSLHCIPMDVVDPKSVEAAFKLIQRQTSSLDILINNAGRMGNLYSSIQDDFDVEDATLTLKTNTLGPLWVTKYALPLLKQAQSPKVIQITSGLGSIADNQNADYYIYRISKAGLNMLNKNLSIDLKSWSITCVAICPGWVQTEMGGAEAPLSVEKSVDSMVQTIERLTMEHTGSYIERFGEIYPY